MGLSIRYKDVKRVGFRRMWCAEPGGVSLGKVEEAVTEDLNLVFCAAGGWAGGSIKSKELTQAVDKMVSFNLHSALQASRIAALKLSPGGLLVLTGAAAALEPTKGMIAYGVTKAATHHLTKSMAQELQAP